MRVGRSAFSVAHGVASEAEHKRRARDAGRITWHMHLGLSDWAATEEALVEVVAGLAAQGETVDRFGLCLSRSMGLPEAQRAGSAKETGPRLEAGDWARVGASPVQPHLGDFMIGTPAGVESTRRALAGGITSIGNLGQFFAFDPPGHHDDEALTAVTADALRLMAAARDRGALVHSYLDDGPAMQLPDLGAYVGWAALELHVVEDLLGARLAHCHGGLVPVAEHRAIVALALDDLRSGNSLGTMVYGNTVGYRGDRATDLDVLAASVRADVATQLRRPTGHAVNPVPLSEAERIPSAAEVLEVHLVAREIEREVRAEAAAAGWRAGRRRGGTAGGGTVAGGTVGGIGWADAEALSQRVAAAALAFRDAVLADLAGGGVDVADPAALLLALRRADPATLTDRLGLDVDPEVRALATWKSGVVARVADRLRGSCPRLDGRRIVLATLEVHDVVRDAIAKVLPERGADVIVLPSAASAEQVAHAAADEDADAVVIGTYNGGALELGRRLVGTLEATGHRPAVVFGGVLNEDDGGPLPVDARPGLEALGVRCVAAIEDLPAALG